MGKRIISERHHVTPTTTERNSRKRKRTAVKDSSQVEGEKSQHWNWSDNDDEDENSSCSSGSDHASLLQTPQQQPHSSLAVTRAQCPVNSRASLLSLATFASGGHSDHNNSNVTESPRPVYTLQPSVVNGTILRDVLSKAWRLGRPIGKGNFGEIFLASDDTVCPVTSESGKYVVKIEPHSNGPLFVEIHCLINTSQSQRDQITNDNAKTLPVGPPSGIPSYIASGTHYFGDGRYRFLVLPRFDRDLHSLIKNARVAQKSLLVLAIRIINVLEHLHDKGYCHNDIKAQNLMISACKYLKRQALQDQDEHYEEKQQTTDSGNSSEQETNEDDYFVKNEKRMAHIKLKQSELEDEDEDFDDGATTNSNNSNSRNSHNSNSNSNILDIYQTPLNTNKRRPRNTATIEFSGSNPMRSCRRNESRSNCSANTNNSMYEEMVKSHYLRPTKRVSYSEFFNEDGYPVKMDTNNEQSPTSSDNESDEFVPPSSKRSAAVAAVSVGSKRSSRSSNNNTCNKTRSTRATRNLQKEHKCELNGTPRKKYQLMSLEEEHIFLIDFGLASKYEDRGVHRPFIMDQRRAHDGTLEFTSRDAHLGAHSRRSDLECLGYNLLYWSEGYLPWKDVAQQQQQEKVHRAKELFMTDVCEMSRQFYGKLVPKYLGEFLQQVGKLAYQERPNYERYRNLFKREYRRLDHDCNQMRLSSDEIVRTRVSIKDEVDGVSVKCDIFELKNKQACNLMRNPTLNHTPFQEHSLTNRVSPKNLRSKSKKRNSKQKKKKEFSWAEVLSQDPDQIARERAVKEFEREEVICPLQSRLPRRYEGKPTYAILTVEQCRRDKGLTVPEHSNDGLASDEVAVADEANNDDEEYVEEDEEQEEDEDEVQEEEDEEEEQDEEEEETFAEAETEAESEAASEEEEDAEDMDINMEQHSDITESVTQSEAVVLKRGRGRPRIKPSQVPQMQQQQTQTKSKRRTVKLPTKYSNSNDHNQSEIQGQDQRVTVTPLTTVGGNNKRGCATRKENATLASATGEVEHHSKLKSTTDVDADVPKQRRRTRRCLYKTESQLRGKQDVENNSSYATNNTNVQNVYSVWQYDDENSYGKGRNVNSSRHCRK